MTELEKKSQNLPDGGRGEGGLPGEVRSLVPLGLHPAGAEGGPVRGGGP